MLDDVEIICKYCNKTYSTKYTKTRHEEKCKYINEIKELQEKIIKFEEEKSKYINEIKELHNLSKQYEERIIKFEQEIKELHNLTKSKLEYKYVNEYFKFNSLSDADNTPEKAIDVKSNKNISEFIDIYIYHIKNFTQIKKKQVNNNYNLYFIQKLKQNNKK
jgi:hypothetical protein